MSITVQAGTTLTFEKFWKWVTTHPNCILRAGTQDSCLYDQEDLHWHFEQEGSHNAIVQLIRGKQLIGEMVVDARDVLFVQATPDPESGEKNYHLFELIGGPKDDSYAVYHFLLAHGFDEESGHSTALKH